MRQSIVRHNRARAAWLLSLVVGGSPAWAENLPFPPTRETICTADNKVDRDRLSLYLIRKYPVSLVALSKLGSPASTKPSAMLAGLLGTADICAKGCAEADQKLIASIGESVAFLISGFYEPTFRAEMKVAAADYFHGRTEIRCQAGQVAEAPGALFVPPPKAESFIPNVRVRGKSDQLYIDRSSKTEFAATDKAIVSYARDDAAHTNTFKSVVFVGYAMDLLQDRATGQRADFIPYLGIDRGVVRAASDSQAKPSAKSSASIGALTSLYLVSPLGSAPLGHLISVRPDFLADHQTGARLASAAIEYFPVRNGLINDFRPLGESLSPSVWLKGIVSLKAKTGHFVNRGIGPDSEKRADYTRLGGKVGIAISIDNPAAPLDFVATYTSMAAVRGESNIDYQAATLTYSFDPDKYFGISLGYKKGKREDTAIRDDELTLGFSARF